MSKIFTLLFVSICLYNCTSYKHIYITSRNDTCLYWGGGTVIQKYVANSHRESKKEHLNDACYDYNEELTKASRSENSWNEAQAIYDRNETKKDSVYKLFYKKEKININSIIKKDNSNESMFARKNGEIIIIDNNKKDTLFINRNFRTIYKGKKGEILNKKGRKKLYNMMPKELQYNWNLTDKDFYKEPLYIKK